MSLRSMVNWLPAKRRAVGDRTGTPSSTPTPTVTAPATATAAAAAAAAVGPAPGTMTPLSLGRSTHGRHLLTGASMLELGDGPSREQCWAGLDPAAASRGQAFDGWSRGLYALAWFDSSTERDFALVADTSDQVETWVRLHHGDLPIVYTEAGQKYEPDFVVIETSGQHLLVEVKADRDLDDVDVQAKKAAAQRWAAYVNDGLADGPHWSYVLVSETDLKQAKEDWAALKELCR